MRFDRGDIVYVNVAKGKDPRHGWQEGAENHELCVVYTGHSDHTVQYNSKRMRICQANNELVRVAHPFEIAVTSLGRGAISTVIDASSKSEAAMKAQDFIVGRGMDVAGRRIDEQEWIGDKEVALSPVLLSVEDKKPLMDTTLALILKRQGL